MTEAEFRSHILNWYDRHKRNLPWRDIDDPYRIWVSEIMLQQTRVDQAAPYYNEFIRRFPTVEALAEADRQEVLKTWEGLGYYSRARHLHEAAQTVVNQLDGMVPDRWDDIISLKGIGPYTASAVLSIAFQRPHAVVDGNVKRVLSRFYGIEEDLRNSATQNRLQELADALVDPERPGDFNQALMELGAVTCTPSSPDCRECPVQSGCQAFQTAKTDQIPYKSPAKKRPHYDIGVGIILRDNNEVLIALRPDDVMLGGLWEFPGGKQEENETIRETVERELEEELGVSIEVERPFMTLNHAYSHFKITLHSFLCRLKHGNPTSRSSREVRWVAINELEDYPFPKANRRLTEKLVSEFLNQNSKHKA